MKFFLIILIFLAIACEDDKEYLSSDMSSESIDEKDNGDGDSDNDQDVDVNNTSDPDIYDSACEGDTKPVNRESCTCLGNRVLVEPVGRCLLWCRCSGGVDDATWKCEEICD